MYEVRRILVPTDFSPSAADAFDHAILLGERFNAELTLLHVDEEIVSPRCALNAGGPPRGDAQAGKEQFFEDQFALLRKRAAGHSINVQTRVASGRAYMVIAEESERDAWDLIVLAVHGWTGLSEHLIGSTAERVVRLAHQPVLSVRQGPTNEGHPASILCPTDLSLSGNIALSYALSIARRYKATLYIQYVSELDKPESESELRQRLPDLREFHPMADEVSVEWLFDRDVDPSNSIIRFAEDRDVDLIVMSLYGRKGIRRVYIGNTSAEVVRQSSRPVLTVPHPFVRQIFSHPMADRITVSSQLRTTQERRAGA